MVHFILILHNVLRWQQQNINQTWTSQQAPHTWPYWVSYRMSVVRKLGKNDRIIMAPHCLGMKLSSGKPQQNAIKLQNCVHSSWEELGVCVLNLLAIYEAFLINSVQMGWCPTESFVVHIWKTQSKLCNQLLCKTISPLFWFGCPWRGGRYWCGCQTWHLVVGLEVKWQPGGWLGI